ncbi:MAG: hypothetical protein ACK55I_20135, partial [bacterium]
NDPNQRAFTIDGAVSEIQLDELCWIVLRIGLGVPSCFEVVINCRNASCLAFVASSPPQFRTWEKVSTSVWQHGHLFVVP